MLPMKPKKDPQAGALDALMGSESGETPIDQEAEPTESPKEDPSELLESIRADVERLSSLLSTMG